MPRHDVRVLQKWRYKDYYAEGFKTVKYKSDSVGVPHRNNYEHLR